MTYWKFITILARFIGTAFILGGVVFCFDGARLLLDHNATIQMDSVATSDPYMKFIPLGVGVLSAIIGVLSLIAKVPEKWK